jgi:hypothetical protein
LLKRLGSFEIDWGKEKLAVASAAGWAGYEKGETPADLIERAERSLYANKRKQIESASPPAIPSAM